MRARGLLLVALVLAAGLGLGVLLVRSDAEGRAAIPNPTNPHVAALLRQAASPAPAPGFPTTDPTSAPTRSPAGASGPPTPTRRPSSAVGTPLVAVAGWGTYDGFAGSGLAAGPVLRRLLGAGWRAAVVSVCGPVAPCRRARIVDWCACGVRHGLPTVADLGPILWAEVCGTPPGLCRIAVGR